MAAASWKDNIAGQVRQSGENSRLLSVRICTEQQVTSGAGGAAVSLYQQPRPLMLVAAAWMSQILPAAGPPPPGSGAAAGNTIHSVSTETNIANLSTAQALSQ